MESDSEVYDIMVQDKRNVILMEKLIDKNWIIMDYNFAVVKRGEGTGEETGDPPSQKLYKRSMILTVNSVWTWHCFGSDPRHG